MATLHVQMQELLRRTNQFQGLLQEMHGRLNALDAFMEQSLSQWHGISKEKYHEINAEWQQGAREVNQIGEKFSLAVAKAAQKFNQAEANNLEAIARTRRNFT